MSGETGGCQCGAVRFRVDGALVRPSLCHCRMCQKAFGSLFCQKAFGSLFGPLVSVKIADLVWTRGARRIFASSNKVDRGFCADCGTPLTFEWSATLIDLAIGAFDDPAPLRPVVQMAVEAALPWVDDLPGLPTPSAEERVKMAAHYAAIVSYQHPDHDTDVWPPAT